MGVRIRPLQKNDAKACGKIGFEAHRHVSSVHGYPSEQPSEEYAIELIQMMLENPNSRGFLAERESEILGSIFLHRFPPSPIDVIGPLTVNPSSEGGVGKALMGAALSQAYSQNCSQVRLVQSPSHTRSFVLYTKSGFTLREPLFLMHGNPQKEKSNTNNTNVRPIETEDDVSGCNKLCETVHGFTREGELRQAMDQQVAIVVEQDGSIRGYSAGMGLFGHSVALSNNDLKALIAGSSVFLGPGFFVPARNREIIVWLLERGFQVQWPANLMSLGPYQEPVMPFLPSLAY